MFAVLSLLSQVSRPEISDAQKKRCVERPLLARNLWARGPQMSCGCDSVMKSGDALKSASWMNLHLHQKAPRH